MRIVERLPCFFWKKVGGCQQHIPLSFSERGHFLPVKPLSWPLQGLFLLQPTCHPKRLVEGNSSYERVLRICISSKFGGGVNHFQLGECTYMSTVPKGKACLIAIALGHFGLLHSPPCSFRIGWGFPLGPPRLRNKNAINGRNATHALVFAFLHWHCCLVVACLTPTLPP